MLDAFGALAGARACALDVEFGDSAVRSAHVAVKRAARVKVNSRERPFQVEGARHCGQACLRSLRDRMR